MQASLVETTTLGKIRALELSPALKELTQTWVQTRHSSSRLQTLNSWVGSCLYPQGRARAAMPMHRALNSVSKTVLALECMMRESNRGTEALTTQSQSGNHLAAVKLTAI